MNLVAGMCCVKCIINIGKYSDFYNRGAAKSFSLETVPPCKKFWEPLN